MNSLLKTYIEKFVALTPETESFIEDCFEYHKAKKNEILVAEGKEATDLYFVLKGCIRVFVNDSEGRESTRFLIFEGQFGTAFPSFIMQKPSSAIVQCLEETEVLMLKYDLREKLIKNLPGFETLSRIQVEQAYIDSIQRIESFITVKSKDRYRLLLKNNPDIIQRVPARIVADYLGISQETLSRLKSEMSSR